MTLLEAIDEVRTVGSIRPENGKLRLRFPELERARLKPAIEVLRRNRDVALAAVTASESGAVPPSEAWPESLRDVANQRGQQTGDAEAARQEIWISWCEWKARGLNRLFQEHGLTGQPGRIKPETIRDGVEKSARGVSRLKGDLPNV